MTSALREPAIPAAAPVALVCDPAGFAGSLNAAVALPDLGLIRVIGADAVSFLQGQLTQDMKALSASEARLAGYCTPKGRLLATFWTGLLDDGVWLVGSRDLIASVAKRLAMYVMRAKAKVSDDSEAFQVVGLTAVGDTALPAGVASLPAVALVDEASGERIQVRRGLAIVRQERLAQQWQDWSQAGVASLDPAIWARLEVLSATARISARSQELFVPQMVNLERVDGVNFRKGCYPGQEIVARSQYLGKLKRRMFLGLGEGMAPEPGQDVHDAGGDATVEPIGQVVLACPSALPGRFLVQFESRVDGVAEQASTAARIAGQPVALLALPYPLIDTPA